jgi:YidC/Oxa1 family membrane protein insertase
MRGAHWLWVADLSQPENINLGILAGLKFLPIALVVTQFMTQKMTPSPGMDPSQQKMMMIMPLVFGFMFWGASSGLVLYWLTGNVVGVAQQWLLNRSMPAPEAPPAPPAKKKGRN